MYGIGPYIAAQAAVVTPAPAPAPVVTRPPETAPEVNPPCGCEMHHGVDLELDRLRELVAGGMGQWEASRMLWGPGDDEAVA